MRKLPRQCWAAPPLPAREFPGPREAVRRIPALRPELVILDDDLPDGPGADVCRAIAAAEPGIRCVLMTGDSDEAVLIDSILAGAWGCRSKQDDSIEQLRLIRRVLAGHTADSARFHPELVAPFSLPGPQRPDEMLLTLTRQEMNAAIGLGKGLSNRQIGQEMFLAEKTVKKMVSTILMKLGMARRTQAATDPGTLQVCRGMTSCRWWRLGFGVQGGRCPLRPRPGRALTGISGKRRGPGTRTAFPGPTKQETRRVSPWRCFWGR